MHKIKILILTLSCLILPGCVMDDDEVDSTITIINESDSVICTYEANSLELPEVKPGLNSVSAHSTLKIKDEFIKDLSKPNRFLFIYIFDKAKIENTPWQEIIANNLYLECYQLTLQDLRDHNWQIVYPVKN